MSTGLAVQGIQRAQLVHDARQHRVDVHRGTVPARPRHYRRLQRQPAVQGLLLRRLGSANVNVNVARNRLLSVGFRS